jgi:nickel-dependent lactate racemase
MAMRTISLGYGSGTVPFDYDPDRFAVLAPANADISAISGADLGYAVSAPVESPPLEEIVDPGERVLIVVPDVTATAGTERVVSLLALRLGELGVADAETSILVGGTARPPTADAIRAAVGPAVADRLAVFVHDATDAGALVALGETSRGTPVEVNRRVVEADHVILSGAIGFDYLAGFTGGRDAIVPGCASPRSVNANCLLALDPELSGRRIGVGPGRLDGNAVHEDMEEAARMVEPSFLVDTVVDSAGEITAAYAGHWRHAHRRGCAEFTAMHAVPVEERRAVVVVSCGGAPHDADVTRAHKTMEYASGILADGGAMVVLAECAGGLGRGDFLEWFVPGGARATADRLARDFQVSGQAAWFLRAKTERFRILLVSSLDAPTVARMGLEPHVSLDAALDAVSGTSGYILPQGLATLPYIAPPPPAE